MLTAKEAYKLAKGSKDSHKAKALDQVLFMIEQHAESGYTNMEMKLRNYYTEEEINYVLDELGKLGYTYQLEQSTVTDITSVDFVGPTLFISWEQK